MTPEERDAFAAWFRQNRGAAPTQTQIAERLSVWLGYGRSQGWVSTVERGLAEPSRHETVFLAAAVGGDPVEALEVAGYLKTPPWVRTLERKLDRVLAELTTSRRAAP